MRRVFWAAVGGFLVVTSSLLVEADAVDAQSSGDIRFITGMATGKATITYHPWPCGTDYWHCDEQSFPNNTALDLTNATGATGNAAVYLQSYAYTGYGYAVPTNHIGGGSVCPGVNFAIWVPYPDSSVGTWVTSINLVQMTPNITFGAGFYLNSGWTITYAGTVADSHPGGNCDWQGDHLHQSGTPRGSIPYAWTNWSVESDDDPSVFGRQIFSTGDFSANWLHAVQY
jgi:hypothetical protein